MRRRFYPTEFPDRAVSAILRAGRERDIYIGAAPRARTHGGRAAIAWLTTLWIDADTPDAIERLDAFTPAPSILVATGRGRHAYWLLDATRRRRHRRARQPAPRAAPRRRPELL